MANTYLGGYFFCEFASPLPSFMNANLASMITLDHILSP